MPFKSKSQNRACWSKYNRDIKQGKTPTWNCHEFAQETDYASLPEKVSSNLPSGTVFDAVKNNKFNDFMEFLNDSKFDPNAEYVRPPDTPLSRENYIYKTLLVNCVMRTKKNGEKYVVELLKKKPYLDILDNGNTALQWAVQQSGSTENTIRLLIAAGSKLDLKNKFGQTALQLSAEDIKKNPINNISKILIDAGAEIPQDIWKEGEGRWPGYWIKYSKLRQYKIDSLQKQLADYTEILDDLERQYLSGLTECRDIEDSVEGIKLLEKCVEEAKKMAETKPEYKKLVKEYENIMVKKAELPSGEIKKDLLTLSEKDLEIMFKYYKVDNIDDLIEKIYL